MRRGVGERGDEGEEEKEEGERDSACSAMHALLGATVQGRAGQGRAARLCNMVRCRTVRQRVQISKTQQLAIHITAFTALNCEHWRGEGERRRSNAT